MSNVFSKLWKCLFALPLSLFLVFTVNISAQVADNPDLVVGPCEEFNIILVLDESGSIDDGPNGQTNENAVRLATLGLAQALQNSGGEMAIVQFSTNSEIVDIDGGGPGPSGYRLVDADYVTDLENYLFPASGPSGYEASGFTNWECAFDEVNIINSNKVADLVVFMTDGNPTAYVNNGTCDVECGGLSGDACFGCPASISLSEAQPKSDLIKGAGSHMFGLAVGTNINLSNIAAVIGPEEDLVPGNSDGTIPATADYANISFDELQACFVDIAMESCSPQIELEKTVYIGHDAGASCPGGESVTDFLGEAITYCFTLTNLGDSHLELVSFTDPSLGIDENSVGLQILSGAWPLHPADDIPNNTITYYYETTITGSMINTAEFVANATDAIGNDLGLPNLSITDTAVVVLQANPCGDCAITGPDGPLCPGTTNTYSAPITGLCDNPTYTWTVTGDATVVQDLGQSISVQSGADCSEDFSVSVSIDCEGCGPNTSLSCGAKTVLIGSTDLPSISCPAEVDVECSTGSTDPAETGTPTVSGGCGIADLSFEDGPETGSCPSSFERTWTLTDDCGNTATCTQTINLVDTTLPTVTCPDPVTVECGESTLPSSTGKAFGGDECGAVFITHTDQFEAECLNTGVITRTWKVTDLCGNSITCDQLISVVDTQAPSIVCPQDAEVDCDLQNSSPENTGFPVTNDACSNVDLTHSDGLPQGTCPSSFTRTWTAMDQCGNSSTCVQLIRIVDTTAPTLSGVPGATTVECDGVPPPADVTATDACDPDVPVTLDENTTPGSCPQNYILTRTWTATDDCGNSSSESQIITVVDTTAPTLSGVPGPTTVECDGVPPPADVTATDGCDPDVPVTLDENTTPGSCPQNYILTRTWTATDDCGNSSSESQIITVVDTTAPTLSGVPGPTTVECDGVPPPADVTAIDACDPDVPVTLDESTTPGSCPQNYILTRTWTATDDCGNSSSESQIITVVDTTAPTLSGVPGPTTVECDGVPPPADVTATDACDPDVPVTLDENTTPGSCPQNYILTRTWTATDDCGNSSSESQIITVVDTTAPTLSGVPGATTVECDGVPPPADVTATDGCDPDVPVTLDENTTPGSCPQNYILTRTWTATDDCGNSSSESQIITVVDTTAPTLSGVPGATTVECDGVPPPADVTATDGCDPDVPVTLDENTTPGSCPQNYILTRTWTATDDCGNSSSESQIITVVDTTAPTLSGVPGPTTVECDGVPPPADVTATDTCDPDVPVTLDENTTPGSCPQNYILTRTWTATDDCGNSSSESQIITVVDTTAPTLSGVPGATTVECDGVPPPADVTATDACDPDVPVTLDENTTPGSCPQNYILTRTWTATDDCGNSSSESQIITVVDTTAPTLSGVPGPTTVECDGVPPPADVTATDGCDPDVPVTLDENTTPGSCPQNYILTRTWTATDDCGNSSSESQIITVVDTTAPTLSGVPGATTVECDGVPPPADVTATDACDPDVPVTLDENTTPGSCPQNYILTRTWTATDDCGNSSSESQIITVVDTTAPTLSGVPGATTVECDGVPPPADVTATDGCDPDVPVTLDENTTPGSCPQNYILTRTWTATDDCGNSSSESQIITVVDTTAPTLSGVPGATTVECDGVPPPADVTATDGCDPDVPVTLDENTTPGSCPQNYILTRTWTATDDCGNSSSESQIITVVDTTAPTLSGVPGPTTVECDGVPPPADVTATDTCDPDVPVTLDENTTPGSCPQNYILTRTWTATDDCGNSSSESQIITVVDTTAPTLSGVPGATTVECDGVPPPADVTATDACDPDVPVTLDENTTPGSCPQNYILTRTWTATDDCGNSSSESQIITVVDTTAPTLSGVPGPTTVECDGVPPPADVTATDGCDPDVPVTLDENTTPGSCPQNYILTRTWTATDDCGNSSSESQIITVVDTTAPTLSGVPGPTTVECDGVPPPADVTAIDACDPDVPVTLDESTTPGSCPQNYILTRTWTATDDCGNSSSESQIITVVDTTAPTLSGVPGPTTVECDGVPPPADVTATDACDPDVPVTLDENTTPGSCPQNYILTRTWTATDDCGNSSSESQIITVVDTTAPTLSGVPGATTVECDGVPPPADVTATDGCDPDVPVTLDENTTPGSCPQNYILTRTWTATDDCGNSSSESQIITVVDTTAPTLSGVPGPTTVECDGVPPPADVTATDACDPDVPVTLDENTTPGSCPQNYILTRTWTATDDCGNSSSESQIITVVDTTAPTLSGVPGATTVECDGVPPPADVTATDACDPDVPVTLDESTTPGSCPQNYILTRTWTATDDCGNSSSESQIITVVDTTAPTLSGVPGPTTVECDGVPPPADVTATDGCDPDVPVTLDENTTPGSCPQNYILTRTWTATDDCGNSSSESQIITVVDTTAPTLSGVPGPTTVECDGVPPPADVTAIDACDPDVPVTLDESTTPGSCPQNYILTRTWTATDDCGNSSSESQIITVVDTTAPTLSGVPGATTVECDGVPPPADVTATDACDPDVPVTLDENTTPGSCPQNYLLTRTWTATDDCGNSSSESQIITVVDTTAPTLSGVPGATTVECDGVPPPADVTATDTCDPDVPVTLDENTTPGSCPQNYILTRTWTATDDCGNSSSESQIITVVDTTAPTITCPDDATAECGTNTSISVYGSATGSDACGSVSITRTNSFATTCGNAAILTRTWTATDQCGNSTTCDQIITIVDTTPPSITCPAATTVECGGDTSPAVNGMATGNDACGTVAITSSDSFDDDGCGNTGIITRTWTATDQCGNSTTCDQLITIVDTTAPTIDTAVDEIVECGNSLPSPAAEVSDLCGEATWEVTNVDTIEFCGETFVMTRTYVATDACGNSAADVQTITVVDTTPPVIECPSDTTVECGEDTSSASTGSASATDECGNVSISMNDSFAPDCGNSGTLTRTWTAIDECGNSSTCDQIIEIIDTTDPLIKPALFAVIECGNPLPPRIYNVYEDCGEVQVSIDSTITYGCGGSFTVNRVYTAIDACGNSSTGTQAIYVQDNTPPVLAVAPDATLPCDAFESLKGYEAHDVCGDVTMQIDSTFEASCGNSGVWTYSYLATDECGNSTLKNQYVSLIDDVPPVVDPFESTIKMDCDDTESITISASDNCGNVSINYEDQLFPGGCIPVRERTFTVSDECGNTEVVVQFLVVVDFFAPEIVSAPQDIAVDCPEEVPPVGVIEAIDNCDDDLEISFSETQEGNEIIRTWIVSDTCQNSTAHVQIISILGDECGADCQVFETAPVDLTKSFDPVSGVQNRVQLKWYKDSPQVKYTDEDAAACDIKAWPKRTLDPSTGEPIGAPIVNPDTISLVNKRKFYPDGITPRSIFKWPLFFQADGVNNTNRVGPNLRYQWKVRCACEHGAGLESPWSEVKIFNTPDFDPNTGILNSTPPIVEINNVKLNSEVGISVRIRPNPNTGDFIIETDTDSFEYKIIDMGGRVLESRQSNSRMTKVSLKDHTDGIYFIQVTSLGHTSMERLIINR